MLTFAVEAITPIAGHEDFMYGGLACDGDLFYLYSRARKTVDIYDADFSWLGEYEAARRYTALCCDMDTGCFWALGDAPGGAIYRLGRDFKELGERHLAESLSGGAAARYLDCDEERGSLLVTLADRVIRVQKDTWEAAPLLRDPGGLQALRACVAFASGHVCVCGACEAQRVFMSLPGAGYSLLVPVPAGLRILAATDSLCEPQILYALAAGGACENYLIRYVLYETGGAI